MSKMKLGYLQVETIKPKGWKLPFKKQPKIKQTAKVFDLFK